MACEGQSLEDLRRNFNRVFDELTVFTRQVRRLAELSDDDEPEILTFHFIIGAMQLRPEHFLPRWVRERDELAREFADVIVSVG